MGISGSIGEGNVREAIGASRQAVASIHSELARATGPADVARHVTALAGIVDDLARIVAVIERRGGTTLGRAAGLALAAEANAEALLRRGGKADGGRRR